MYTTVEQRKAWAEVHKAITNYTVLFGPIEVGREDGYFLLDDFIRYTECGKIFCPDYKFSLDKKKSPWYNWSMKKRKEMMK